jgi:ribosomal protein S18 acetylase RimI-like enzyme
MRVWVASEEDAGEVTRLMTAFRDWWGREIPGDEAAAAAIARLLAQDDTEFLLAARDDAPPAGVCQLRYRYGFWYDGLDCWLEDLFVVEGARGSGIGLRLSEAAVERARERGCRRVQLDVNEANQEALALYRGLGFESLQDPPGGNLLLMTRWLSPG